MPNTRFHSAVRTALSAKRDADSALLALQQDMREGTQACSISAILSALENCDDALEAAWLEVALAIRNGALVEAIEEEPLPGDPLEHPMLAHVRDRLREMFATSPQAAPPHQNIVCVHAPDFLCPGRK